MGRSGPAAHPRSRMTTLSWPLARRAPLVVVLLFGIALALRFPFASRVLWAWDSVLYARAIEAFDVAQGRPHPPGYLLYVLVARAAAWMLGDANAGLVAVSIVAGAATVALAFVVGLRVSWRIGVFAALTTLASPLLWHYSEVAYPYTLLALLSGAVGLLLWMARRGSLRAAVLASLTLGLASGFRQDLLMVLGPLWLWSMLGHGRRAVLLGALAAGAGCVVWAVPTVVLSEGPERYLAALRSQIFGLGMLASDDSRTLLRNASIAAVGLRWQVHWLAPLVPIGAIAIARRRRELAWPLVLWTAPALLVYLLFHIGEWAYTLSVAIPLALVIAVGADELLTPARRALTRRALTVAFVVLAALNAQSFLFGHGRFAVAALRGHDLGLEARIAAIHARFSPADTVILARDAIQHARYYLPGYRSVQVVPRRGSQDLTFAPGTRYAILFLGEVRARPRWLARAVPADSGVEVSYVEIGGGRHFALENGDLVLEGY
ncbi:MAG TPA: hypothetical protein VFC31_10260 [Candidatus Limnocylindria bacterium]|nr:hypothetical protein [Candidatus Limnocylindria bacterium]